MIDNIVNFIDNTLDVLGTTAGILYTIENYESDNAGRSISDMVVDLSVVAMTLGKKSR